MNKFVIRVLIALGIFLTALIYTKFDLSIKGYTIEDVKPIIDQAKTLDFVEGKIVSIFK